MALRNLKIGCLVALGLAFLLGLYLIVHVLWSFFRDPSCVVSIVQVDDGERLREFSHPARVNSAAFSPDGSLLAVACSDGSVHIRQMQDRRGRILRTLDGAPGRRHEVWFSQDGSKVLTAVSRDIAPFYYAVRGWDVRDGSEFLSLNHEGGMNIAVSGSLLSVDDGSGVARILRATDGEEVRTFEDYQDIVFTPDGLFLVAVSPESHGLGVIDVWQTKDWKHAGQLPVNTESSTRLSISPDGAFLTATLPRAYNFEKMSLYRLSDRSLISEISGSHRALFSPDGQLVATTYRRDGDSWVTVWDSTTGASVRKMDGHSMPDKPWPYAESFLRDQVLLVRLQVGRNWARLTCWDISSGKQRYTLEYARLLDVSPDGRLLAVGSSDTGE